MKYTITIELDGMKPVPGGMRVQMKGNGDLEQVASEFSILPMMMGVAYGALSRKVLFKNSEDVTLKELNALDTESCGKLYDSGVMEGLVHVSAVDRSDAVTVLEFPFIPKESGK